LEVEIDRDEQHAWVLTVRAPDGPGLIASIAAAVAAGGGNIIDMQQHSDPYLDAFGCRVVIGGGLDDALLRGGMGALEDERGIEWQLYHDAAPQRIVICCSSTLHCVSDLLVRVATGDLRCEIAAVISDKTAAADLARRFDIPFVHVPVGEDRSAQETSFSDAVASFSPELVVLARYMRVLPGWAVAPFEGRMINIHHSSLPAFPGANPRRRAHERGVKIIGATAHYVTAVLDEGPIIAQDVVPIGHDTLDVLIQHGEDVERMVLAQAVRLHLEHRVMIFGSRTCVFD
jgi:formyltetrahydrofolate deformylase